MALKIKVNTGVGLKINDDTKALEVNSGNGIIIGNAGDVQVKPNTNKGINVTADGVEVKPNTNKGINVTADGVEVKPNTNKGINVTADGVEVKVDNDTIKLDENGNLKSVGSAPDIVEGQGISITNTGETERTISTKISNGLEYDSNNQIKVKPGNSVSVGADGVTVNVARGVNKQSNQIGLNANFTNKTTPLGDNPSNIELYSDGKIKVVGGGGGGNIILYKKYNNTKWLNKLSTISNLDSVNVVGSASGTGFILINANEFDTINTIPDNEKSNYIYILEINSLNTGNDKCLFDSSQNIVDIVTDDTTTKLLSLNYLCVNRDPICEIWASKNIQYTYGSNFIQIKNRTLVNCEIENWNVYFTFRGSNFSNYIYRVLNNNVTINSVNANFDNNYFKNWELLIYAIPKK